MNFASQNDLKFIRSLQQKKFRSEHQLFVAEGKKLVQEALQSSFTVEKVICADDFNMDYFPENTFGAKRNDFNKLTEQQNPEGVLALIQMPNYKEFDLKTGHFFLLEDIQDPGNLGTIIRIADWFGFQGIICSGQTAEVFNPKVVRASMGSIFRIPVIYEKNWLEFIKNQSSSIVVADLNGKSLNERDKNRNLILLGNESAGVQKSTLQLNIEKIKIPGKGGAESLNVAVSAGIIAYHVSLL